MKQYRGCSHLYYAIATESQGVVTYGSPKVLAPVKAVSRDIASDNEAVYADNVVQQRTYGATAITRSFDVTRIAPSVVADLMGEDTMTPVTGINAYMTTPSGDTRPTIAVGFALHDGDPDNPVELYWCYNCKVNSISKTANTIDDGTGSEGQSIEIVNNAPKAAWTQTGKRNLDFGIKRGDSDTAFASTLITKFFTQVVTPDNAATVLA